MKKNKKNVDLSIVIINFGNTKDYTKACLDSVYKTLSNISYEVIVIDNISTDGTREMVQKNYKDVIYIRKDKAYNFSENNNTGFNNSNGRYVLFLNSDTEVLGRNTFKEIIDWMDSNPKIGAMSTSLYNSDNKSLQGSGGSFPDLLRVLLWMTFLDDLPFVDLIVKPFHPMHGLSPLGTNSNYYKKAHQQDWVTGAFYLARREALVKSGLFDEKYNGYVEEVDLSYRIKNKGYEIWYNPKWRTIHHGGASYGSINSFIFELKNLKMFYQKFYPEWQLPVLNFILKLGCVLRIVVFGLLRPKLKDIYLKALHEI